MAWTYYEYGSYSLLTLLLVAVATAGTFTYLRGKQLRTYAQLPSANRSLSSGLFLQSVPDFRDRLALVPDVVPPDLWKTLSNRISALGNAERSYLPVHKKGGTIAYETLCVEAPEVVAFYRSPELARLISDIVGTSVQVTPLHDQSSCSVLIYDKPGDHIGWHYDHNFYRGRHFTVLIPIVNQGREPGSLSAARLMVKQGNSERVIAAPPNMLVVFEGAKVLHKVTPIEPGERRVVLSMTFCTDPSNGWLQGIARRVKDTAFFGIRALWT